MMNIACYDLRYGKTFSFHTKLHKKHSDEENWSQYKLIGRNEIKSFCYHNKHFKQKQKPCLSISVHCLLVWKQTS